VFYTGLYVLFKLGYKLDCWICYWAYPKLDCVVGYPFTFEYPWIFWFVWLFGWLFHVFKLLLGGFCELF
jgi:hypothetical protein